MKAILFAMSLVSTSLFSQANFEMPNPKSINYKMQSVIFHEIDNKPVQDTGMIAIVEEPGIGDYVSRVFIIANGTYREVYPMCIKYVPYSRKNL